MALTRAIGLTLVALVALVLLATPVAYPPLQVILDPVHGVAGSGAYGLPSGVLRAQGIPGEATVLWDSEGVPHIFASTDEIGVYALGYVMASLRLFQMDLMRRIPQGTLSELVGEAGFENDKLTRTLGLHTAIRESWELLRGSSDPELRRLAELIEYFVRGVNDYISSLETPMLPPEYRLLGLKPEPWKPEDVMAIQKLFTMMLAWDTDDLVLEELVRRWGLQVLLDLDIVNRTLTTPQAYCSDAIKWGDVTGLKLLGLPELASVATTSYSSGGSGLPSARATLSFLSRVLPGGGGYSNNWVVGPGYTVSGKPIVANDPHLALTAPSLWMLVHLETPSVKVAGVTVPGAPVVIIGRNERLAWGFTNVMGDFVDFYYYKWDGDKYLYKGSWLEARSRVEVIKIWDPMARRFKSVELRVLETVHGPVIEVGGERYAVAFTGSEPSLELAFIWGVNRASSVVEALQAQRYFTAPIQNFVVADSEGNIAYSPTGAHPLRVNLPVYDVGGVSVVNRGFLPFNGSSGEGEWAGFIGYAELPVIFNPPRPFIVTANSKPFDGVCGLHIGWNWADRFRQDRITELLANTIKSKGRVSIEDVMRIQTDNSVDLSLRVYTSLLVELARRAGLRSDVVEGLANWLSQGAPTTVDRWEPSVALTWAWFFHRSLWSKLYGSPEHVGFFRLEHAEYLLKLYINGDPRALRYLALGEAEEIALETLNETLKLLKSYYGLEDYRSWVYGKLHYYHPTHPILKSYSYDRFETGGGPYSVNPASPAEISSAGAPVRSGASIRLLSDLSNKKLYTALPGGNHGNPYSEYYQNHYRNYWVKGGYYVIELGVKPEAKAQLVVRGD